MLMNSFYKEKTKEELLNIIEDLNDEITYLKNEVYKLDNYPHEDYYDDKVMLDKYKKTIYDLYLLKLNGSANLFDQVLNEFFFDVLGKRL